MAESLDQKISRIRESFHSKFQSPQIETVSDVWVRDVFDDHVIVDFGGKTFQIGFTESDDGDLDFAPQNEWIEVTQEWITKSIKVLDGLSNDDELVLEGYIALYEGDDLTGERFTKSTDFESTYTRLNAVLIDWEHGLKPDDVKVQPGRDDVLGHVDSLTMRSDDIGLLARHVLDRRERYVSEFVEPLARAELLGSSSEAIPDGVQKTKDGTIEKWPLKRQALSVSPAETRLMTDHQLEVVKSLCDDYPTLKSLIPQEDAQDSIGEEDDPQGADNPVLKSTAKGDKQMAEKDEKDTATLDDVIQVMDGVSKVVDGIVEQQKNTKAVLEKLDNTLAPKKTGNVDVVKDSADKALKDNPFKAVGDFYMEVKKAAEGNSLDERLLPLRSEMAKEGAVYQLPPMAQKALKAPTGLSEVVPADGGFLVGSDRRPDIGIRTEYVSQVWNLAMAVEIGPNSNGLTMNVVDETSRADGSRAGGVLGYWAAEADEKTKSKPTFDQIEPKLKKVLALVYATDEVLEDATALGSIINILVPQELDFQKDDKAINGSGVGVPLGILNSPALVSVPKETGQAATTVTAQNIINMYSRREGLASQFIWFINQDVEPQLHQLELPVGTGGALVYLPPGGLSASPFGSLYGRPVVQIEQAATLGTVGDIMFVNMGKYLTIGKGGVRSAESIHVRFIYDESVFRFVERVDGMPMVKSALTPFKGSATRSPFVVLATRE